jgi:hypothetical protein
LEQAELAVLRQVRVSPPTALTALLEPLQVLAVVLVEPTVDPTLAQQLPLAVLVAVAPLVMPCLLEMVLVQLEPLIRDLQEVMDLLAVVHFLALVVVELPQVDKMDKLKLAVLVVMVLLLRLLAPPKRMAVVVVVVTFKELVD